MLDRRDTLHNVQETLTITAAEIARLAGVGRAAVSNWRKRFADFPSPVGGTAASPEFDLAQVEQWLREQGKLAEVSRADRLWHHVVASKNGPAATLADVGAYLLAGHRGEQQARKRLAKRLADLLPEVDALGDEFGQQAAFDQLWQRFSAPGPGRPFATPDELADLMVDLAGVDGGSVLDPATGTGATLRAAVRAGSTFAHGQELDVDLARLAELWLALRDVPGEVAGGDSLRADAFAGRVFDAVVCHPPFGVTNWGLEDLGYDQRWEYGVPPRTEPELAWAQHALAHLRPGAYAVLLMPPTVAGRRGARRIRGQLLRAGALRAIIALPGGSAAPHAVPLHLWVLRRPLGEESAPARALLADAVDGQQRDLYRRVRAVWKAFAAAPEADLDEAGFARAVPVIDLLDEEIDLTPARRQTAGARQPTEIELERVKERLAAVVKDLPGLIPETIPEPDGATATAATASVAELVRIGALQLIGPIRSTGSPDDEPSGATGGLRVLTGRDVASGGEASGWDDGQLQPHVSLVRGDVVVPTVAPRLIARVIATEGTLLGRNLYLLRPNPAALDPWFLAGQLRASANERQTSSLSGTTRYDVRRAQVRRLPLPEQREHGAAYRRLEAFESAIQQAADLGAELARLTADGLAGGSLRPGQPSARRARKKA
ncbi:N-6 DNA methylase [Asanoa ferruginea]|uniref:N-6 DNA methylase n=2 Tax=Asanoa ferruginea TaxID=53367 RepID=A0A3D9ZUZ8_9ACTN|nr:N-6 DNA methylase [Asanoa ferruginea]GIF48212.1 type II restriction endonuclease subunit M [Asanoa ferruginea]